MKKGTRGFRGHLLIYCLRCRPSCSLAIWSKSKSRQTKTTGANQLRVVPYEWSACDSPSSSPPLSEPVHQPCADPRPEKDSLCNQSVAPFTTSELFKREGNHKRRRQKDCSVHQKWTTVEDGGDSHTKRLHHRIICLIFSLRWTEPSCWGKPKLPECNTASTIWVCRLRDGGYSAVCDELAEMMPQSDQ